MTARRSPPPWSIEELDACVVGSAEHCGHLGVDWVSLTLCPGRPDNSSLWLPLKRGSSVRLFLLQSFGQQTTAQA